MKQVTSVYHLAERDECVSEFVRCATVCRRIDGPLGPIADGGKPCEPAMGCPAERLPSLRHCPERSESPRTHGLTRMIHEGGARFPNPRKSVRLGNLPHMIHLIRCWRIIRAEIRLGALSRHSLAVRRAVLRDPFFLPLVSGLSCAVGGACCAFQASYSFCSSATLCGSVLAKSCDSPISRERS